MLLAVDESANAKFASHISGLLAGTRGLPVTVLHVGAHAKGQEKKRGEDVSHEAVVKNAAKAIAEIDEDSTGDVDVTTRAREKKASEAIADEAQKGIDLLVAEIPSIISL